MRCEGFLSRSSKKPRTSLKSETILHLAEILYNMREEMAQKLTDVVLRRTELGSAGHPGASAALTCAEIMAVELGWNEGRMKREIEELKGVYQPVG